MPGARTDGDGAPRTEYWAETIAVVGADTEGLSDIWPWVHSTAADGVALLPTPDVPFRLRVHLERNGAETIVGSFERGSLPEGIERLPQ